MFFKKSFWLIAKKLIADYTRKNKFISRCYIRNSAALEPQNPFLSDFDLTYFVDAPNFSEFCKAHGQIRDDFKKRRILPSKHLISHFIIFPATKNAYNLCKQFYPQRSVYPMKTWLPVDKKPAPDMVSIRYSLPLDHRPENFLSCYMIPALIGRIPHAILESMSITRKLKQDSLHTGTTAKISSFMSFYEVLLAEIDIWDQFYANIKFPDSNQNITVRPCGYFDYTEFSKRWDKASSSLNNLDGISSLWVYPASRDDNIPNLVLNLKPNISAKTCQKTINTVLEIFKGLDYTLFLGRETSMIARINGLSRVSLLEPWLFKYYGCCLFGNPKIKENIKEPSIQMLKEKYREFLLYFSYKFMYRARYPYNFYKLCFTLDYLFKHGEIILDNNELAKVYGSEFIPQSRFNPKNDMLKL